jgi:hypothetical protein
MAQFASGVLFAGRDVVQEKGEILRLPNSVTMVLSDVQYRNNTKLTGKD